MKITNKTGLPEAFYRAVLNDPYTRGASDYSPSSLSDPSRAYALLKLYGDDAEVDCASKVATIIGNGAHAIAERAARPEIDIVEKRYFSDFEVDGVKYTVSAQIDLYETDTGRLYDWKTTKAYAFSKKAGYGKKPDWITQMNIGAELMRRNGLEPKTLHIIAMLKDWSKREAGTPGCPEQEVVIVDIPVWTSQEIQTHIEARIRSHVAALKELPKCTSAETWGGNRCSGGWCDASSVCTQYKEEQKTGLLTEGD